MDRHRKHICRLHFPDLIPVLPQILHISCQCCRITAHIYNPLRLHLNHGIKYTLFASFSWRIDYDHICVRMFSRMLFGIIRIVSRQHFFCLTHEKFSISQRIDLCILFRIVNCLRNDLYTIDLFRFLCKEERNGSDSTVQIPHGLVTGKSCIF